MNPSFQLKGSLFTLSVLQLESLNLNQLDTDLSAKIELAPKFFDHAPIVVDVSKLDDTTNLDFVALKKCLEKHQLIAVGVKGAKDTTAEKAKAAGLAVLSETTKSEKTTDTNSPMNPEVAKEVAKALEATRAKPAGALDPFKLVTEPVRSGQQVYAPGDLVIVGTVSPGAELLAEGNIHVYGKLQGRALAGINGNTHARVFCRDMQAELVAIAGAYKVFEDHNDKRLGRTTQIYLNNDKLVVEELA